MLNKQVHCTLMSIFFFFLVVLMPRVLFLCMPGFSAFFADIPGLGFLALHRLPPNNSTAWAKVGPSYRPSSYKEPYAEHTSKQQQGVNTIDPSKFPELDKLRHLEKQDLATHVILCSDSRDFPLVSWLCPQLSWSHPRSMMYFNPSAAGKQTKTKHFQAQSLRLFRNQSCGKIH